MIPKLSSDLEQFVRSTPSGAARVEGADGAAYWVMTDEAMKVRQYVHEALQQADRGDVGSWNADDIKSAGRKKSQEPTD